MTNSAPDPFAPLEHAELLRARVTRLPLREMGGAIVRAAETVMTMPAEDGRRPYAQEYLLRLLVGLERYEEAHALEQAAGSRRSARAADSVMLFSLYGPASTTMRHDYGGTDPLSAVDIELGVHDAETARLCTEGLAAADAVLTREVLGFPPLGQGQQPQA